MINMTINTSAQHSGAVHTHLHRTPWRTREWQVTDACKKHGGFYLGSIGGPAAILAQNCIRKVEVLEYPELGMEAIWKIDVENFPAFIVVNDLGDDFFKKWLGGGH